MLPTAWLQCKSWVSSNIVVLIILSSCSNYVLDRSSGLEELGEIRWQICLCLLLAWVIVFLCIVKGVKSSGKVGLLKFILCVDLYIHTMCLYCWSFNNYTQLLYSLDYLKLFIFLSECILQLEFVCDYYILIF